MGLIIFAAIAAVFLGAAWAAPLPESDGWRLIAQLSIFVTVFIGPVICYSYIATALTRRAVTQVGSRWCIDRGVPLERVEMNKNHFTVIYSEGGKKLRAKFRVKFVPTTWYVKEVTWL